MCALCCRALRNDTLILGLAQGKSGATYGKVIGMQSNNTKNEKTSEDGVCPSSCTQPLSSVESAGKESAKSTMPHGSQSQSTNSTVSQPSKNTTIRMIIRWVLVGVWAALIFYMSSKTSSGINADMGLISSIAQYAKALQANLFGTGIDIISPFAHFCEYMLLAMLLANALRTRLPLSKAVLVAIVIASAYGVTDEFHQYFVPERMCDPLDWLVDTIGAGLGATIAYAIFRRR